jgi:ParB-like chromosome segregation protein Spo0J
MLVDNSTYKLVQKKTSNLRVAPTNVRTEDISTKEKEIMNDSVKENGIWEPLIINEQDEIISGQLRWQHAMANDIETVWCNQRNFDNKFDERICCLSQDYLHHNISDKDKYLFVKKAMEEDGKTYAEIAKALGVEEPTIRNWTKYPLYPSQIEDDAKHKQMLLDLPSKKKIAIQSITESKQFKNSIDDTLTLIEESESMPLGMQEAIRKQMNQGLYIDMKYRVWLKSKITSFIETYIPKDLDYKFTQRIKVLKLDYDVTLFKLIKGFTEGKIDLDGIEKE